MSSSFEIKNGVLKRYAGDNSKVVIPDSVKSIDSHAFFQCTSLASITIPDSVKKIDDGAFFQCTSLASITIPNSVESISRSAFLGCTSLTDITIPNSVESIGRSAFSHCTSLTSITIPDSVKKIDDWAFSDCTSLTNITIPNSVESIGPSAFSGCTSLTSITIPNSVESIDSNAFSGCTSLTSITIPDSVKKIDDGAFSGCNSLTSITIPNSVESIGTSAFYYCTSLTSITIPGSMESIDLDIFATCTSLTNIEVDENNAYYKSIDGNLYDKDAQTLIKYPKGKTAAEFVIPDFVTNIGMYAFSDCTSLTNITIPNSVESIGSFAFSGCTSLASITIPDSVKKIDEEAFYYCTSLANITIPNSVESIGTRSFSNCTSLTNITIPNSVESIGPSAFSGCTSLTSITIPNSVESIDSNAFSGCTSLTSITIPDSVKKIDDWAFSGCTSLANITIPNSVESIGRSAFSDCTSLASITIPDSVKIIDFDAFSGCVNLKEVIAYANNLELRGRAFERCTSLEKVVFTGCIETAYTSFGYVFDRGLKSLTISVSKELYEVKSMIPYDIIPYLIVDCAVDYATLWIFQSGKDWDAWFEKQCFDPCEVFTAMTDLLGAQKKIKSKQVARLQEFVEKYSSYITNEFVDRLINGLLSDNSEISEMVEKAVKAAKEKLELENNIPLEQKYAKNTSTTFSAGLDGLTKGVKYKNYDLECSVAVIKTFLEEYIPIWNDNKIAYQGSMSSGYNLGSIEKLVKPTAAEEIAAELDPQALSDYLEKLAFGRNYRYFAIPYACFATNASVETCVREIAHKSKGNMKSQYWADTMKNALYYSDTEAAVEYIEKKGDFAKYTELRGMSVQDYRDTYSIPDFGFNIDGVKKYTVDGKGIEVRITNNFALTLTDSDTGNIIKSISKKTESGAKAAEDFATIKKDLNEFYKKRIEYIKKIYITGEKISEQNWKNTYMLNPLFRPLVESLIWHDDNGMFFDVFQGVCRNVYGIEYMPVGSVRIAHVLDMITEQIDSWQKRVLDEKKPLLIEQIWEPISAVENVNDISSRYEGCVIRKEERNELKRVLKSKAIDVRSEEREGEYNARSGKYVYDNHGTMLLGTGLIMDYEVNENNGDTTLGTLKSRFRGTEVTREFNTVIFELDRITIKSLIVKDDAEGLMDDILQTFTVAQISSFLDLAIKNGSTQCTARLLNYKNTHFETSNPFDMFVLE